MFFKLLTLSALLLSVHSWALSCSPPKTISDQRLDAHAPCISSNKQGDVFVIWLSMQGQNERLEVAHKTQNSPWSAAECLSSWESFIFPLACFTNAEGDCFTAWQTAPEHETLIHVAEKIGKNPWRPYLNWISSNFDYAVYDLGFDARGGLAFIGETKVPYAPPPMSKYFYRNSIPALTLSTKLPAQVEPKSALMPLDLDSSAIGRSVLVMDKNGTGYAFWVNDTLGKHALMYQKISDSSFVSDPEEICSLEDSIYGLEAALNEKGDLLIAYLDCDGNATILNRTQNCWSEPVYLINNQSYIELLQVAIDSSGNMMVLWEEGLREKNVVRASYKPAAQFWQTSVSLSGELSSNCHVQSDGAGNFLVLWQEDQQGREAIFGRVFSTQTQTWSPAQRLSPASESCFGYGYTLSTPGKGYIVWTMGSNGYEGVIQVAEFSY